MGNTIKNYEKKQRKERKDEYREMRQMVHDAMFKKMGLPREFAEKEAELFSELNQY